MLYTLLVIISLTISFGMYGMEDSEKPSSPFNRLDEEPAADWSAALEEDAKEEPQQWRAPRIDPSNKKVLKGEADKFIDRWSNWQPVIRPVYASSSTFDTTSTHLLAEDGQTCLWKTGTTYHAVKAIPPWKKEDKPIFTELLDENGEGLIASKISSISSALAASICAVVLKKGTVLVWTHKKGGRPSQVLDELAHDVKTAGGSELDQVYAGDPEGKAAFDEIGSTLAVGDKSGRLYIWERNDRNIFVFKRNSFLRETVSIDSIATDGTHAACASKEKIFLRNIRFASSLAICEPKSVKADVHQVMLYKPHDAEPVRNSLLACILVNGRIVGPSKIADFEDVGDDESDSS